MRLRNAIFALLAGLTTCLASAQQPAAHRDHDVSTANQSKEGTVKGVVRGSDEIPGPWTIIIEGENLKRVIASDEGHFEFNLPPGVYTARVKTDSPDGHNKRIPYPEFLVEAGEVAEIEVDPTYEKVFCNYANDMVVPVVASSGERENRKGLRRPFYETYQIRRSENISLRMVTQYCKRVNVGRLYRYKSANIKYDTISLSAANIIFDPLTYDLSGWNVYATQHGTGYEVPYATASLGDGKVFLNLAADQVSSLKGSGEIESGTAVFNFKIEKSGNSNFTFEDRKTGLKLKSRKDDCMIIMVPSAEGITFWGSARVSDQYDARHGSVVHYTVTLKDFGRANESKDRFTISIPSLMNYKRSGRLTSGDIEVSNTPKSISQQTRSYPEH